MQEIDIGLGPFGVTAIRAEVVDYTHPILIDYARILGGRGSPELDPWGFLLPLSSTVWMVLIVVFLLVILTTVIISKSDRHRVRAISQYVMDIIRVSLGQGRFSKI